MPPHPLRQPLGRRRLGAIGLALPAIWASPARAARGVTIAAFGGWFQSHFDTLVLGAFRKAHPAIGVFQYPIGNSFQGLALLRAQRALPSIEVMLLEAGVAATATADGLLVPLLPDAMPVLRDLAPQALLANVAGPGLMMDSLAVAYSPAQLAQAPRSWRNLWDSRFGQRIALQTPPDPAALALTAVAGALFGGADLLRSLDVGITAIAQLAPRVVLWDPVPDIYTAIALGDAAIGPGWNARSQAQAAAMPGRFAAAIPNEGSPVRTTTVNLVKGCAQPDEARILIAWLLGPEGQRLLAETMFYAPVNAQAGISAASLDRVGATPAMVAKRMEMDWVVVDAVRGQIATRWRARNLGGRG